MRITPIGSTPYNNSQPLLRRSEKQQNVAFQRATVQTISTQVDVQALIYKLKYEQGLSGAKLMEKLKELIAKK